MKRRSVAVLLGLVAAATVISAAAQEAISRKIRIVTDPAADVCEIRQNGLVCLGRSPTELELEFRNAASARRLHLVRVAYEAARITVSPDDTEVRVALRPRSIYARVPTGEASAETRVAASVNDRLRDIFFGPQPPAGLQGFQFLGEISVVGTESGRFEVIVPVMVDDQFRVRQLAAIERMPRSDERPLHIAQALWDYCVGPLGTILQTALLGERAIAKITIAANYSRARYVLVDDDSTFLFASRSYSHSTYRSYGNVVERVDHYRVTSFQLPTGYTKLAATKKIYVMVFAIPLDGKPHAGLDGIGMLSNDNRSGELIEIRR